MPAIDPIQTINREVVKPDEVSVSLNELGLHPLGYALPLGVPFRYVPKVKTPDQEYLKDSDIENAKDNTGTKVFVSQAPLTIRCMIDGEKRECTFPLDPVVSVNGKNVIARRYVAKGSVTGSVKESWSQDDYEVTIAGSLIECDGEDLNNRLNDLREILECGEVLAVYNDWLNSGLHINNLVVEAFSFPHTKGLQNQTYTIKCFSDSSINVLEEKQ